MISRTELARKAIHFLGLLYIPGISILGKDLMVWVVLFLTAVGAVVEVVRKKFLVIPEEILRDYEKRELGAFIYTGIAFSVITPVLPVNACLIAAVCAFAGDGVSGIFKKIRKELAFPTFFLSSLFVAYLANLPILPSLLAILVSYVFDGREFLNDNLTIPVAASLSYLVAEVVLKTS